MFKIAQTPLSDRPTMNMVGFSFGRLIDHPLTNSVEPRRAAMSHPTQNDRQIFGESARPQSPSLHRQRSLRVLFFHRVAEVVASCLRELEKGQFTVSSDIASGLAHCTERLRSHIYDAIVVEHPHPDPETSTVLFLLHQTGQEIPVIFLTNGLSAEHVAALTAQDAFD
jgi:CheY-like chemotaxis protein